MKTRFLLVLMIPLSLSVFGQNKLSNKEVNEDLDYLRKSLEEAHYNLYAYITKEAFNQNFSKVKSSITKDSLSILETTSLFQSVISKANNGHTEIPFPVTAYFEYADSGGTLFPIDIAFENGKALVRKNLSNNHEIQIGSEVIRINNLTINEVLERIFPLISAERRYFKLAKLELFSFPRYFWQAWGEQKSFEVVINNKGKTDKYQVQSISIEDFHAKRNEVFNPNRELRFLGNAAYLKPGDFSGDEKKYKGFIDSAFVEINDKNLPNLIIDLRNNLGGNDSYSDFLVSYLANRPFRWCSEFTLKTSSLLKNHVKENYDITKPLWKSILDNEDGTTYPYEFEVYTPQPKEKRYTGNVYVLINRQSHSQSAVTASQIQDYEFGTIVGEETGDFPSLYASQYSYNLPNSGIEVKISKGYIVRVNGSKKAEGVIPDIYIKDHLIDENDEILNGLLNRLNNKD